MAEEGAKEGAEGAAERAVDAAVRGSAQRESAEEVAGWPTTRLFVAAPGPDAAAKSARLDTAPRSPSPLAGAHRAPGRAAASPVPPPPASRAGPPATAPRCGAAPPAPRAPLLLEGTSAAERVSVPQPAAARASAQTGGSARPHARRTRSRGPAPPPAPSRPSPLAGGPLRQSSAARLRDEDADIAAGGRHCAEHSEHRVHARDTKTVSVAECGRVQLSACPLERWSGVQQYVFRF